jgi:hypothetical protein
MRPQRQPSPRKNEDTATGRNERYHCHTKPSEQPVKHAEPAQPPRPKTASLFDMPAEPPPEAVVQAETEDQDDILAEIKDDGAEEEEEQEDVVDAA